MRTQSAARSGMQVLLIAALVLIALACVVPFVLVLIASFTDESELITEGIGFFPELINLNAYKLLFSDAGKVVNGYKITILVTVFGTALSLLVNAMLAYPLSKKSLKYRHILAFYCFFTMLFSGGIVPWYIITTKYLGLHNNLLALIVPYTANAWYMFLIRNYFKSLPDEIGESASIDGAGEWRIFFRIILPLSIPALASVTLFISLYYWNDWWLGIMLNEEKSLMPLQLLLREIVSNAQFAQGENATRLIGNETLPTEGIKYAATIITIGPIIFLYPFLQKYFVKGLMVGAVKG
ncbi:carbohydrate ABC transporter permease [Paenibacillus beijingensis]|uniref:Sugar ABC transporter permease n=1 Tax=Paenibacillus beijingensis TaxID=1126833 RepID=A0A0D5NNV7_9BACL|nr:carbohydrate ABC transporter permease [Paenibacillus beijingensis]AJY76840.1 sugar ABC transporter permease [Paenibacillus beijingensis]